MRARDEGYISMRISAVIRGMRDDEKPEKQVSSSRTEHARLVGKLIDAAPWFGEKPFVVATRSSPPRNAIGDDGYARRVFVSWLIGRPVSTIAERVGCSPRLVHKILDDIIYVQPAQLWERWVRLGLIGFLDTPYADFEATHNEIISVPTAGYLSPWATLVFCQICHRPIAGMRVMSRSRKFDGSLLRLGDPWQEDIRDVPFTEIQVHLIRHFALKLPKINPPRHAASMIIIGLASKNPELQSAAFRWMDKYGALERRKPWITRIWPDAAIEINRKSWVRLPELLPIQKGAEIDSQEAKNRWARCLGGGESGERAH